jgi:hypothetical protein
MYDAVVELRERRLDEEEAAAEVSKALEALGKDRTLLVKKAKLVDASLAAINQVSHTNSLCRAGAGVQALAAAWVGASAGAGSMAGR